jgi:hypothetical protein
MFLAFSEFQSALLRILVAICIAVWLAPLGVAADARPTLLACGFSQASCRPAYGVIVTYHWDAQPMDRDYKVFVHIHASNGNMAFQADHDLPAATSKWSGALSYDETLVVPLDLAPGEYRVVAGLWNPQGGGRPALNAGPGVTEFEPGAYVIGIFTVAADAPLPELPKPTLQLGGYHLTFDESFKGKLDVSAWGPGTRWIAHTPWNGDFGDARFVDPRPDFPFTVRDGVLRIEARKVDGKWQSGLLSSVDREGKGFAQKFGYFEMKAKLPKGPGVWPAFWLCPTRGLHDKSVTNIEYDVLEQYGANPNALCITVHYWGPGDLHRSEGHTYIVPGMTDDFHRYGVMVEEDFTTFHFDGVPLWRLKTPEEAKVPLYPLLNLALGSGFPIDQTPDPSVMEVQYVHAWSR